MNSSFSKLSYHPLFPLFLYISVCTSQIVNHSLYLTTFLSFILSLSLYKTIYLIASLLISSFFFPFLSYPWGTSTAFHSNFTYHVILLRLSPHNLLLFLLIMWSFRRAVAPITKRFVNQPHVRMMSNNSTGGFYRSFGNTLSFYNANKGVLNFAAGALIILFFIFSHCLCERNQPLEEGDGLSTCGCWFRELWIDHKQYWFN